MSLTNLMLSAHIVILAGCDCFSETIRRMKSSFTPRGNTNKGGGECLVSGLRTVYTELQDKTKDIHPIRRESLCQILGQGNFLQGAAFWVRVGDGEREGGGGGRESCIVRKSTMERIVLSPVRQYQYLILGKYFRFSEVLSSSWAPSECCV